MRPQYHVIMASLPLSLSPMTPHPHRCCSCCYPLRDTILQCEHWAPIECLRAVRNWIRLYAPLSYLVMHALMRLSFSMFHFFFGRRISSHFPPLLLGAAFSTPAFSAPMIIYLLLKCDAILKAETNPSGWAGHEECGMGCSRAESGRTVYVMEIQKQHDSNELKRQGRRCSAWHICLAFMTFPGDINSLHI